MTHDAFHFGNMYERHEEGMGHTGSQFLEQIGYAWRERKAFLIGLALLIAVLYFADVLYEGRFISEPASLWRMC